MTITELVDRLKEIQSEYGNLEVGYLDHDWGNWILLDAVEVVAETFWGSDMNPPFVKLLETW